MKKREEQLLEFLGQLQNGHQKQVKFTFSFFKEKEGAIESIIAAISSCRQMYFPTCSYFQKDLYNEECHCELIKETSDGVFDDFSYVTKEIFCVK